MTDTTAYASHAGSGNAWSSAAELEGHSSLMTGLADSHKLLVDLIGKRRFHYVDLPVHGNIGDLLIMLGTMEFFRENRLSPRVIAPTFAYRTEWLQEGETVVFHGGGNFGDLYWRSGSQPLREKMVEQFPENRIIVLPQTFHFSSAEQRSRSARIFRAHPDVHICVRDEASRRMGLDFSTNVYLLPDMAHHLYPIPQSGNSGSGILALSRTDGEVALSAAVAHGASAMRTDWPEIVGLRERYIDRFRRIMRLSARAGMGLPANKLLANAWMSYSRALVGDAVRLFSGFDHIATDRLHGHILACLMNKPSTVIDNCYGKNSGYVNAWTRNSGLVTLQGQ